MFFAVHHPTLPPDGVGARPRLAESRWLPQDPSEVSIAGSIAIRLSRGSCGAIVKVAFPGPKRGAYRGVDIAVISSPGPAAKSLRRPPLAAACGRASRSESAS